MFISIDVFKCRLSSTFQVSIPTVNQICLRTNEWAKDIFLKLLYIFYACDPNFYSLFHITGTQLIRLKFDKPLWSTCHVAIYICIRKVDNHRWVKKISAKFDQNHDNIFFRCCIKGIACFLFLATSSKLTISYMRVILDGHWTYQNGNLLILFFVCVEKIFWRK